MTRSPGRHKRRIHASMPINNGALLCVVAVGAFIDVAPMGVRPIWCHSTAIVGAVQPWPGVLAGTPVAFMPVRSINDGALFSIVAMGASGDVAPVGVRPVGCR
eukprot:CAMPEP_0179245606 /NCGR_PEP_ID=MMETSP0797-20121207/18660_1 /TAXON_ID=47934 /ORGANISM="Dinophysis acuminata, Strain DAEP01" /LENGTH=102 /DNA_ID=CAMNT_0020953159 /DNA_START=18 /DNA_END=323 /DNA_ORIENTATION=-